MLPICVTCQVEFRPATNGVLAVSMSVYEACEVRRSDLLQCPECGVQILSGFGARPQCVAPGEQCEQLINREDLHGARVIRYWMNPRERDQWMRNAGEVPQLRAIADAMEAGL